MYNKRWQSAETFFHLPYFPRLEQSSVERADDRVSTNFSLCLFALEWHTFPRDNSTVFNICTSARRATARRCRMQKFFQHWKTGNETTRRGDLRLKIARPRNLEKYQLTRNRTRRANCKFCDYWRENGPTT